VQRKTILILALTLSLVITLLVIASDEEIRLQLGLTYWAFGGAIIACVLLVLSGYIWDRSLVQRIKALHAAAEDHKTDIPVEGEGAHDEIIGLARNIERMAQSLQKIEASYRGIVEDQLDLICRYRGDGKLTFVNGSYAKLYGQKRQELVGQPFPLFHLGLAARGRADAPEEISSYEASLTSSSGEQLWLLWTQRAIRNPQGEVLEYQAVGHDITPRKQAETALQAAKQAAETADRAKTEFLAMVTHEIRTPINGVLGFATLLRDSPLTPEQCEQVEMIRLSAENLETLVTDILDLSKIESGKIDLEHQAFALHKCVEDVCASFAPKARAASLVLNIRINPDVPAIVNGDQMRLRQILANLVGNAIKFTERGGVSVHVSCAKTEPTAAGPYPAVRLFFAVSDTGIGIPAEKLAQLFQPFSQVDASHTRRRGGTGLGLIICRRLCEFMGGAISVESRVEEGSTVRFSILADYDKADTTSPFPESNPAILRTGGAQPA
jgi:PAS domain S-box-containing protein